MTPEERLDRLEREVEANVPNVYELMTLAQAAAAIGGTDRQQRKTVHSQWRALVKERLKVMELALMAMPAWAVTIQRDIERENER